MYSAYQVSTGEWLKVGRNSKTKEDCINDIWNFIMEDVEHDEDNIDDISNELEMKNYTVEEKEKHLWVEDLIEIKKHSRKK